MWGGSESSRGLKRGKGEMEGWEDDVVKMEEEGRRKKDVQVGKDNGFHHHHR
jgi:hypothetical protein